MLIQSFRRTDVTAWLSHRGKVLSLLPSYAVELIGPDPMQRALTDRLTV